MPGFTERNFPFSAFKSTMALHSAGLRHILKWLPNALLFLPVAAGSVGAQTKDHVGDVTGMQTSNPADLGGVVVKELRSGLYWVSDGAYNTMFLVSTRGVIAVDPLPTLGPRYIAAIRSVTSQPITHIVYSHEHIDHIGGAEAFPKGLTIIAQRFTYEALGRQSDPRRPLPTVVFDKDYTLRVGDQVLELHNRGPGHSPGNVFIYAPRQKVLMLVDIVYPGYMPYPNLGVAADVAGYMQAHRDALTFDFEDFIGGHVDRLGTRADVENSMIFTDDLLSTTRRLLAEKPFPVYLKERKPEPGSSVWFAHDDYERERVDKCYQTLAPKWAPILRGTERFLASHCWKAIVGWAIELPADFLKDEK